MRVRYASTVAAQVPAPALFEKFATRPATATLAASRFRSAVKSIPGSVSSKSLMSKRYVFLRGGEGAEVHQVAVAATLHGMPAVV